MNIQPKENNCCDPNDDTCCQPAPKKKNVFGKIIFAAVIAIATGMIVFKVFIQEPQVAACDPENTECCASAENEEATKETINE